MIKSIPDRKTSAFIRNDFNISYTFIKIANFNKSELNFKGH